MPNIQPKIDEIKQKTKKYKKDDLKGFIDDSLLQVEEINNLYVKFFEKSDNEKPTLISEIESKLENLKSGYENLFNPDGENPSKITDLNKKIEEIKKYHQELLDGDNSIKADVEKSQKKITDFYIEFFGDDGTKGKKETLESAIKSITDFESELNKDDGYKTKVENAKNEIIKAYNDLFAGDEKNPSKHSKLNTAIKNIEKFNQNIKDSLNPYFNQTKKDIEDIKLNIKTKDNEIGSLLSNATAKTLAQGYLESMGIYGNIPNKGDLWSNLKNFFVNLFNYFLFILPLVIIGLVFAKPDLISDLLNVKDIGDISDVGSQYWYKISISTPLLWISWFGQKNISQRKRLFEEYNHKLRVVQMYLLFISKDNSYKLEEKGNMGKLESILLEVIGRNPCKFLGKDLNFSKSNVVVEIINALKSNPSTGTKPKKSETKTEVKKLRNK